MPATQSPESAPRYALHRDARTGPDTLADVPKGAGMNMEGYENAHIQVVPSGGANPNVAVYWWSEAATAWVQEHTPITRAGVGVDTPYEFTVQPRGRRMLVAFAALAAGQASVYVAGFRTVVQPIS